MLVLQRFAGNASLQLFRRAAFSSTARVTAQSTNTATAAAAAASEQSQEEALIAKSKGKSSLVAAAFESLKNNDDDGTATTATAPTKANKTNNAVGSSNIDERIVNAKTVNGLLAITENNATLSRTQALKIVSILAEWSSIKRIKLTEFENDSRFLRLCRILGRTVPKGNNNNGNNNKTQERISGFRTDDLNTVLGVAGDDEAAKLIASISVPQMVKVLSTLAQRKRRSTPLLRSLAYNISSSTEQLDLKQCGDVLYAMATLNFQDSVLAAKLCADIQQGLPNNLQKSAVVGSILTSLGLLKYRDLDILEALTQWMLEHHEICRPQDLSAYFLTCSMLNFKSSQLDDVRNKLVKSLVQEDFSKPADWLNHTWALALLNLLDNATLQTVLSLDFITLLQSSREGLSTTSKMKLLNLNSFAQLLAIDYKGDLLSKDSNVFDVPLTYNKTKQILLNALLDALKSLLPANNHVQSSVDSRMGFLIDAVCMFDAKRNPIPLDKPNENAIKVALMVVDFHDVCHGSHRSASGVTNLYFDLLEKSGYKVLAVPYNEFNTSDKLLKRVQYLEAKFKKAIVTS